mmetsp:Transcript_50078/g.161728  ORF Transcript_50078/g.161728 Transcript_50078/m.161728 type:complete len:269 (-) Transcript_50078:1352-2158(-)
MKEPPPPPSSRCPGGAGGGAATPAGAPSVPTPPPTAAAPGLHKSSLWQWATRMCEIGSGPAQTEQLWSTVEGSGGGEPVSCGQALACVAVRWAASCSSRSSGQPHRRLHASQTSPRATWAAPASPAPPLRTLGPSPSSSRDGRGRLDGGAAAPASASRSGCFPARRLLRTAARPEGAAGGGSVSIPCTEAGSGAPPGSNAVDGAGVAPTAAPPAPAASSRDQNNSSSCRASSGRRESADARARDASSAVANPPTMTTREVGGGASKAA